MPYERFGGIEAFLKEYVQEVVFDPGYPHGPLEEEAERLAGGVIRIHRNNASQGLLIGLEKVIRVPYNQGARRFAYSKKQHQNTNMADEEEMEESGPGIPMHICPHCLHQHLSRSKIAHARDCKHYRCPDCGQAPLGSRNRIPHLSTCRYYNDEVLEIEECGEFVIEE